MQLPSRKASPLPVAACLLAVALGGCATVQAARYRYLQSQLQDFRFQEPCGELWPAALKLVNGKGFPVVGADHELIGEAPQGFFSKIISDGFSTHTTANGGLVAETNWNQSVGTRYRIQASPEGPKSCQIVYIMITGGAQGADQETVGPDWAMLLDLVAEVDPAAAAKIEAGAPKG